LSFEEYLAQVKKEEKDIKDSFKLEAEKRIKNYLTLREIGKAEKIEVSTQELEEEMNKELRRSPKEQADKIDIAQLREYTKDAIMNEKIFQMLETFSKI
jgi:trigger factor